ncbi:hypothetical protein M2341_000385 [Sphingobium sp. B7D2B]|uniref:hypothetical protein n=1 Tax=Sphingobium sp. B7D2B TaxID=2940583 RepID=UPI0022243405|nr:hypothetical protein [Sphingobium sp. B7D2B]MCW2364938.1 hypothetical protein [Sphingobium sp. B7D2B]
MDLSDLGKIVGFCARENAARGSPVKKIPPGWGGRGFDADQCRRRRSVKRGLITWFAGAFAMNLLMQWPVLTFIGMVAVFGVILAAVSVLDLKSE